MALPLNRLSRATLIASSLSIAVLAGCASQVPPQQ